MPSFNNLKWLKENQLFPGMAKGEGGAGGKNEKGSPGTFGVTDMNIVSSL